MSVVDWRKYTEDLVGAALGLTARHTVELAGEGHVFGAAQAGISASASGM